MRFSTVFMAVLAFGIVEATAPHGSYCGRISGVVDLQAQFHKGTDEVTLAGRIFNIPVKECEREVVFYNEESQLIELGQTDGDSCVGKQMSMINMLKWTDLKFSDLHLVYDQASDKIHAQAPEHWKLNENNSMDLVKCPQSLMMSLKPKTAEQQFKSEEDAFHKLLAQADIADKNKAAAMLQTESKKNLLSQKESLLEDSPLLEDSEEPSFEPSSLLQSNNLLASKKTSDVPETPAEKQHDIIAFLEMQQSLENSPEKIAEEQEQAMLVEETAAEQVNEINYLKDLPLSGLVELPAVTSAALDDNLPAGASPETAQMLTSLLEMPKKNLGSKKDMDPGMMSFAPTAEELRMYAEEDALAKKQQEEYMTEVVGVPTIDALSAKLGLDDKEEEKFGQSSLLQTDLSPKDEALLKKDPKAISKDGLFFLSDLKSLETTKEKHKQSVLGKYMKHAKTTFNLKQKQKKMIAKKEAEVVEKKAEEKAQEIAEDAQQAKELEEDKALAKAAASGVESTAEKIAEAKTEIKEEALKVEEDGMQLKSASGWPLKDMAEKIDPLTDDEGPLFAITGDDSESPAQIDFSKMSENMAASTKFLEANKLKKHVVTLPSGLQYKVLKHGDGLHHPALDTPCHVEYVGKTIDGTEFGSTFGKPGARKLGRETMFVPKSVIKGWTEGMQLMVEGDKWEMYIPSELAFGEKGSPGWGMGKIPSDSALIVTMQMKSIPDQGVCHHSDVMHMRHTELKNVCSSGPAQRDETHCHNRHADCMWSAHTLEAAEEAHLMAHGHMVHTPSQHPQPCHCKQYGHLGSWPAADHLRLCEDSAVAAGTRANVDGQDYCVSNMPGWQGGWAECQQTRTLCLAPEGGLEAWVESGAAAWQLNTILIAGKQTPAHQVSLMDKIKNSFGLL